MKKEKWKLVGGRVYRLAEIFDSMLDAKRRLRELKENNHVFLSKVDKNLWAVYYRPKNPNVECNSKYFNIA
ncbi:MAG: hypothetical protein EAX87_12815 [Candidatus Thorarchaeota archaeon]|nr:hypothetical protein [Candidatus Thorarchaeota archaeon]